MKSGLKPGKTKPAPQKRSLYGYATFCPDNLQAGLYWELDCVSKLSLKRDLLFSRISHCLPSYRQFHSLAYLASFVKASESYTKFQASKTTMKAAAMKTMKAFGLAGGGCDAPTQSQDAARISIVSPQCFHSIAQQCFIGIPILYHGLVAGGSSGRTETKIVRCGSGKHMRGNTSIYFILFISSHSEAQVIQYKSYCSVARYNLDRS